MVFTALLGHLQNEDTKMDRLIKFIKLILAFFRIDEGSTSYSKTLKRLMVKFALSALGALTLLHMPRMGNDEWNGLMRVIIGILISFFSIFVCFIAPLIELSCVASNRIEGADIETRKSDTVSDESIKTDEL